MTNQHPPLNAIGVRHNTDKANQWSGRREPGSPPARGHDYLVKYESFLRHFVDREGVRILELGAGPEWNCGASARMWEEYFPQASDICIAEIRPDAEAIATSRVRVAIGDLGRPEFLAELAATTWDVIIDDASHQWHHQTQSLLELLPAVKPGGVFILEDVHTSFGDLRARYGGPDVRDANGFVGRDRPDPMHILTEAAYLVAGGGESHPALDLSVTESFSRRVARQVRSITFVNHAAVIVTASDDGSYLSFDRGV
ncbi:MAG: class I SAM-dependent methyltransferase [Actinomycetota bacterium]